MAASGQRRVLAVGIVLVLLVTSIAVVGAAGTTHPSTRPGADLVEATAPSGASTSVGPSAQGGVPSSVGANSSDPAGAMADSALAAAHTLGVSPNVVSVPRPSATPQQIAEVEASGTVRSLYTAEPAPIGLAYYGVNAGPGGRVVGTTLNTTRLLGTVDMNSTGILADDLFQSSPDGYAIQLNAVLTNVTLFGKGGYSFWTQNFIEYYSSADLLVLISNVWNWSGLSGVTQNAIYAHGPLGTNEYASLGFYYAEDQLATPIAYPFDLTLYMNSTLTDGRDAVDFTDQLSSTAHPGESFTAPFDYVVFNSLAPSGAPLTTPSPYTANGRALNGLSLTDDFELVIVGPGDWSQATLFAADATLGLGYWTGSGYASVPAASSYGGETGETSTGANVAWSDAIAGRPFPGLTTYGTVTTGPSLLMGLWNATTPEGSYPVTLDVSPANAFNLFTLGANWSANFTFPEASVAPEMYTDVVYLAPGLYTLESELSGYAPVSSSLNVTGPTTVTLTLTRDAALGIYTPLWAFSNREIAAISTSGTGTPADPYVIENDQPAPIGSAFGLYNDRAFPVYPAVFLHGTNATTEFDDPPSFATSTFGGGSAGSGLPLTNDLQYWFENVSNVSVVNATNISGWFADFTYYPIVHDTFSMIFYEGGHNLVANDTFDSQGQALLLFSGGSVLSGPLNVGGGNNTVWGNHFREAASPPSSGPSLMPETDGLAMEIAESGDLVYNNYVDTPTTAWLLPLNLYSGAAEFFQDAFNISEQNASVVHYAPGFPFEPLSGSIVGGLTQGGNFWWDYGLTDNPYNHAYDPTGLLPYEERAVTILPKYYPGYYNATYLYPGGDDLPFGPSVTLYSATFTESGLPPGTEWYVNLTNVPSLSGSGPSLGTNLTNGTYPYSAGSQAKALVAAPGSFTVEGGPVSLEVSFHLPKYQLTILESGLPPKLLAKYGWTVAFNGSVEHTTATALGFSEPLGTYGFFVVGPKGYSAGEFPQWVLTSSAALEVSFSKVSTASLLFTERGLAKGQRWCVEIASYETLAGSPPYYSYPICSTTGTARVGNLTPGTYPFEVLSPLSGQNITQVVGKSTTYGTEGSAPTGKAVLLTFAYRFRVTFTESGLPSGGTWSVTVRGVTHANATGDPIVFDLSNGTYGYKVGAISGYTSSGSPKKAVVPTATSVAVTFTAKKAKSGSPVAFVGMPLLAAAAVPLGWRRSRGARSPSR